MSNFSRDFARITRNSRTARFEALTPEDKATHKRWVRIVLAFYCSLFVLGGTAIVASHSISNSHDLVAQASLQKNSPSRAGH